MSMAKTEDVQQYVTFKLGDECFAVEVSRAREILDFREVTRVPQTPKFMLGVLNLRGSVVPVIDMRLKLGMPATEKTVNTCIIVMEIQVDGDVLVVGALADSVQEVSEFDPEQIEPPPRIGSRLKTEYIRGMSNVDGQFIIILDIDRVFSAEELTLVASAGEEAEAS
ncbi:CheW protein [Desulfuromonas soudanensis]|uniref:CheW protein n=1 Tax=Desulfuromonas soudanensis TaxID=1603606 RepID=A0A0M4CWD0_9BACT|nr:chemotaxis protein CheW [Desulfuromonas soudanensis]ALC16266.1 CheW protein [Desulfuromonas soudanensis]